MKLHVVAWNVKASNWHSIEVCTFAFGGWNQLGDNIIHRVLYVVLASNCLICSTYKGSPNTHIKKDRLLVI